MLKHFFSLTKPGIIGGNLISCSGGFLLASQGNINYILFSWTLVGVALIIASGCVINNYIDHDIDKLMARTKTRVAARGLIRPTTIISYGLILGLIGSIILSTTTNIYTTIVALCGWFVYVFMYSLWFKRRSIYATHIGSIAGAIPPVIGYCAVAKHIDLGAFILFLMLCLWQMPHSLAITIFRIQDYKAARIPVLPLVKGVLRTKISMLVYTILFAGSTIMLSITGYTSWSYLILAASSGIIWIALSTYGFKSQENNFNLGWARKIFMVSIISLCLLCTMMAIDYT